MSRGLYIADDRQSSEYPLFRKVLIFVLLTGLLAGVAVGAYLYLNNQKAGKVLESFQAAMADGQYGDAVDLYRDVQAKALAAGPLDQNQEQYQDALAAMEKQVLNELLEMEKKLIRQETLTEQESNLAEDLAELSASSLISWLRGLCADYLFGDIERPLLEHAFAQISHLPNVNQAVKSLPEEFDRMSDARPILIQAQESLAGQEYWTAYTLVTNLVADEALTGFVRDQSLTLLDQCKNEMYGPLLQEARLLMEGGRYLSAQSSLRALADVFPEDDAIQKAIAACADKVPEKLAAYQGPVEFLTIKPLIVNPAKAFDGDAYAGAAADSMITVSEFSAMLDRLYENQFILIDSNRIYTEERQLAGLQLPPGKKPLVLVLEGLNYYATRRETGNAWNLVLDESEAVCAEYPDQTGQMVIDRRGEAIGILDEFVASHPDFSLDGAKGTISLTGYECVFGYVTDEDQLDDRNQALQDNGMAAVTLSDADLAVNRDKVKVIIDRLKSTGWQFASSTYGFIDANSQNMDRIRIDTEKWLSQVGSLTGPVSFLNYPNGAFIQGSDKRAEYLKDQGFILFGGIGTNAYVYVGSRYIYVDKTPVNGFTLKNGQTYGLNRFFNAREVYDAQARKNQG